MDSIPPLTNYLRLLWIQYILNYKCVYLSLQLFSLIMINGNNKLYFYSYKSNLETGNEQL